MMDPLHPPVRFLCAVLSIDCLAGKEPMDERWTRATFNANIWHRTCCAALGGPPRSAAMPLQISRA